MQVLRPPTASTATSRATPWHRQHSTAASGLHRSLRLTPEPGTRTSRTSLAVLRDSASAAVLHPSQTAQPPPPADSLFAAAAVATPTTATGSYTHAAFAAFFVFLGLVTAAATNRDWYLDVAAFGGLWGLLWAGCARLQPSRNTVTLLCVLPVMHLLGALGLYSWELGNLSWDVLVHISNGFIATLLFAAVLADLSRAASESGVADGGAGGGGSAASWNTNGVAGSAGAGAAGAGREQQRLQPGWQARAVDVLKLVGLLLLSTSMVEVVETAGGQLAGHAGEGMFLRGPGDMCTASLPCSEEVDTLKDMVDGFAGMGLALLGLATRGGGNNNTASIGGCPDSTDA